MFNYHWLIKKMSRDPDSASSRAHSRDARINASKMPHDLVAAGTHRQLCCFPAPDLPQSSIRNHEKIEFESKNLSDNCKKPRLTLMNLPLELREQTYHFLIPGDPEIRCTNDLTIPLVPETLKNLETVGSTTTPFSIVPRSKELSAWMCIAARRLPQELLLNKQVMYEASIVFIRKSKFVFQGTFFDGYRIQYTLGKRNEASILGLQAYLDSFPANEGYMSVRRIQWDQVQVDNYKETGEALERFLERCTGLRELEIPGCWVDILSYDDDDPDDSNLLTVDDWMHNTGLSKLLHIQRALTVTVRWGEITSLRNSSLVRSFVNPFFDAVVESAKNSGSMLTLRCAYVADTQYQD